MAMSVLIVTFLYDTNPA